MALLSSVTSVRASVTGKSSSTSCGPSVPAGRMGSAMKESAGRPPRVVFCVDTMDFGGSELNAYRLGLLLRVEGVALEVCSIKKDGPLRERYEVAGIVVTPFPFSSLASVDHVTAG